MKTKSRWPCRFDLFLYLVAIVLLTPLVLRLTDAILVAYDGYSS